MTRPAIAQTFTGSVDGAATDSSGAAVPGARVTLHNLQTDDHRTAVTNDHGQFLFPAVPPGSYELILEATGFKKSIRGNVLVEVQQSVRADVTLELGSVSETVEVQGEVPLLQPSASSLGQVIDNRRVVDLPLNGRNVYGLLALTPGVTMGGNIGGQPTLINSYSAGNFSASGSLGYTSETIVDGVPVNGNRTNSGLFLPSIDALEEFKVQTNNFSAEFGRTAGGVVNMAMKSGTNTLHGVAYDFFRNRVLDANNFFSNRAGQAIPGYTYNVFGGTLGGPVIIPKVYNGKDRTFFFVSYEGFRNKTTVTPLITVPSLVQRQGDFSQTLNAAGQLIAIYDPLTTRQQADGTYTRTPFAGNLVPANRIDPVAAKMITYYGVPNLPGNARTGASNFIGDAPSENLYDEVTARFDQTINAKNRVFGRYSHNAYVTGAANIFGNAYGGTAPSNMWVDQAVLRYTFTPSPTLLVDLAAGATRSLLKKTPLSYGQTLTTLGFPQSFESQVAQVYFPSATITNMYTLNGGGPAGQTLIHLGDNTGSVSGSITKIAGIHSIKAGADYRNLRLNDLEGGAVTAPGTFNFTPQWTQQNPFAASTSAGVALASFLLGYVDNASQIDAATPALQNIYLAGYVQDDIRLNPKLTLNLGFRYDVETPHTDRYNELSWFNFTAPSPLAAQTGIGGLQGGLQFAGVNGNPRQQMDTYYNRFSPRFGLAYSWDSKTVIRLGYGIFFGPDNVNGNYGNLGFSSTTNMSATLDGGLTPADVLRNPYPKGLNAPTGSSQGLATFVGQSLPSVYDRGSKMPYAQQWNFDVQRQLPGNILVEAAYAGAHDVHLLQIWSIDQLNPSYYSLGSQLQQQVPNPFRGLVSVGPLSAATVSRSQLLLPYPQFLSVTEEAYAGNANYNSFQLKVERRLTAGLMFLAAYTNSKTIGDVDPSLASIDVATGFQNNYNRRLERSLVPTDISQRLVFNFNYELPFGRGKRFGSHWNRVLDIFAGGWQLNGITTFQTGTPLYIYLNSPNPFGGTRPNNNGTTAYLDSSDRSIARAFNTSVFSQPPSFSLGNTGRTLPDVRAPGIENNDLSLFKIITLTERAKLHFRFEAFNGLNRAQFTVPTATSPTTGFGNPLFGQYTTAAAPRVVQLALKLYF